MTCRNSSGRSPSIQSRPLSLRLRHFWSPKKSSEGQTIHLGRRRQTVRAELFHIAAPGILRASHSPPCVTVVQQPGLILLTYRYWFQFLGLRLVSFLNAPHNLNHYSQTVHLIVFQYEVKQVSLTCVKTKKNLFHKQFN